MYYPKQIPYVLDQAFRSYIDYEEFRYQELEDYCLCIWTMRSKHILDKTIYNYILPDACIDLIIDFSRKAIYFSGYSKETIPFALDQSIDYMGVRLKPGAFHAVFGIDADKVMDHAIVLSSTESIYDILKTDQLCKRLDFFKDYLYDKVRDRPHRQWIDIVERLYQDPREQNVQIMAHRLGYDQRQLYRVFKKHYGISPKVLLNTLRLHLCLTLMLEQHLDFSEIAYQCGFYDQAHFIKEIKRYTGFSPLKLLEYR